MIDINEYISVFPGEKASNQIGETELNEIILSSMPNGCSRKSYVQGFIVGILFLKDVDMFEHMEMAEFIYEGVVEP